ncbi:hypothetical protein AAU61_04920 [Desulfocarbo indianensis]|nr:hypothetical protein AAU61_04920 [Desulfocarbo indianensis]
MFKPLSIKTKLSLGLSLLLMATFLTINLINYYVSKSSIRRNIIGDALPVISSNIYSDIQKDLIIPINVSSLMANDTFLKDWVLEGEKDLSKIKRYLNEIRGKYGFFSVFLVSDKTKNYYHFKGIHKQISTADAHDVWYYAFKKMGVDYDLDVDTDEAAKGALAIFINHRLLGYDGGFLGATGVGLNMDQVGALLQSYRDKYHKNVYLVDSAGLIQVHPDKKRIQNANIYTAEGLGAVAGKILGTTKAPLVTEYNRGDDHLIVLSRFIPEFGWFLLVEQVENEALADIRANLIRNLLIGLAVTLFVILVIVLMVNHFQGRLEALATTDELTQVPNRRHFMALAEREIALARRTGQMPALIMMDVDHFKAVNDRYGHGAGDWLLKELARIIAGQLRDYDVFGRWGGEEFAAFLPYASLGQAMSVAERIRQAVEAMEPPADLREAKITVSLGVAIATAESLSLETMVIQSDAALYQAKQAGRNQVKHTPVDAV